MGVTMTSLIGLREGFLRAILHGWRGNALEIVREAARSGATSTDIYVEIFQEAMYEVGRLWESNRIEVATEHIATAVTQNILAQLYFEMTMPSIGRGNVVITGVEGELHNVGAHIVADALENDGWNVRLLGSDLCAPEILKIVERHEASVLGISTTMRANLTTTARLIHETKYCFGPSVRVMVGGGVFRSAPLLALQIGADGFAPDVRSAVEMLRREGDWT